jgi:hypothetical protein
MLSLRSPSKAEGVERTIYMQRLINFELNLTVSNNPRPQLNANQNNHSADDCGQECNQ